MPREKAVPTRRTVHQFHEERIERQPAIDDHDAKGINDIDIRDGGDDDDDDGADIEDNDHNIEKHVQSYGRWKTEPNEMDQKRSFSLEGSSSDSISDEVIMFHHHISVNLHRDILNNLDAVERLGLFCEGQHLVIEAVDGPSLDGFSCRALFPCSLLRAVRRDVCQGGLNLRVLCWDKDGFNVQVSVNLTSETMISATSMEWLLSSLSTKLSATDSSHRVRVGSNNCRADDIVSEMPTWFTPFSEEFCTEAFLETASAFQTSLSTTSSSLICGSGLSMLSELGQELKNGGLTTALRSYQLEGVHWLLKKLSCSRDDGEICNFSLSDDACGRCDGWVQLPYHCNQSRDRGALRQRQGSLTIGTAASSDSDTSQQTGGIRRLWYNLISERLTSELPPHPGSGSMAAVLADEMGIGKSIQVLSLVLLMKLRGEGKGDREESTLIESVDTQGTLSENRTELVAEKLLYSNNDGSLKIPDSIDPHDSTAERKRKRKGENLSDFPCLCNRRSEKKQDMGWVECSDCMRWLHVKCCGFSSAVEASREENFKCLACSCLHYSSRGSVEGERGGRVSSSATLILMPATLVSQWRNEIHKHFESRLSAFPSSSPLPPSSFKDQATSNLSADALLKHSPLRVFVYEGCDDLTLRRKGLSFTDVDPRNLASKYDIVFMSLKTLTKEFHQAQNATLSAGQAAERVSRRHGLGNGMKVSLDPCEGAGTTVSNNWGNKLYVSFPPPFMCIHWAMVVVDETQKIESESISQSLFLCKQLSARRRLCVTGTPLGSNRSSDLHSLCQFLHVSPYGYLGKRDWLGVFGERSLIRNERIRNRWLVDLFAPMVLRRTKRSVAEQLGLESPITTVRLIDFSGFEVTMNLKIYAIDYHLLFLISACTLIIDSIVSREVETDCECSDCFGTGW